MNSSFSLWIRRVSVLKILIMAFLMCPTNHLLYQVPLRILKQIPLNKEVRVNIILWYFFNSSVHLHYPSPGDQEDISTVNTTINLFFFCNIG